MLFENNDLKVTNAYNTNGTTNDYAYNEGDITFTGCVNIRGKQPNADNVIGEVDKTDHSPLILEVKNAMKLSAYVRTGDNKKLSMFRQNPFEEVAVRELMILKLAAIPVGFSLGTLLLALIPLLKWVAVAVSTA